MYRLGSSPLTRGKRFSRTASRNIDGLIPAHAGKTCSIIKAKVAAWAHPRSRGENAWPARRGHRGRGSSPLTRGKPELTMEDATALGLIPAHAGKTVVCGDS